MDLNLAIGNLDIRIREQASLVCFNFSQGEGIKKDYFTWQLGLFRYRGSVCNKLNPVSIR